MVRARNLSGEMSEQLAFDLPFRPAFGYEDFLVSDSNAAAVWLVDSWPEWGFNTQVLYGPAGCGKSHLAHVWREKSGATTVAAGELVLASVHTADGVVVEDVDRSLGREQHLFHLLNMANEQKFNVLLTARTPSGQWKTKLPDLRSRLCSLPLTAIGTPDDQLLQAVLIKLFADRQIDIEPKLIKYITTRMPRSMQAARQIAEDIDKEALATGKKIGMRLIAKVLG
jgi:chromosomal replication initiation ATPase DnaA